MTTRGQKLSFRGLNLFTLNLLRMKLLINNSMGSQTDFQLGDHEYCNFHRILWDLKAPSHLRVLFCKIVHIKFIEKKLPNKCLTYVSL